MKKLMIRCETDDGDVEYFEITEDVVYFTDFYGLKIDICSFARKYYPDLLYIELDVGFIFVDGF